MHSTVLALVTPSQTLSVPTVGTQETSSEERKGSILKYEVETGL